MKKLSFIILLLFVIESSAQPYYFSQRTETYTPLSGSVSINNGTLWSGFQKFTVPIGFTFQFMGSNFTSVDLEATGRLIFDVNHYYFADMFVVSGMRDKGQTSSLSPLSYKLTGSSGNYILKIEVNNATYQNDINSTVNYQIWLYESSSTIELHVGPNNVPNPSNAFSTGAFSGVFHVTSFSPITYAYGLAVHGSPVLPTDTTFSGTGISTSSMRLNDIPNNGAVYKYSTSIPTAVPTSMNENQISVYPNPVAETVSVDFTTNSNEEYRIDIHSIHGQSVRSILTRSKHRVIDLANLNSGIYFITVSNEEHQLITKKIVKQ